MEPKYKRVIMKISGEALCSPENRPLDFDKMCIRDSHTGEYSCFFNTVQEKERIANSSLLYELYDVIADRKINPKEGSYTNYLFEKGIDVYKRQMLYNTYNKPLGGSFHECNFKN